VGLGTDNHWYQYIFGSKNEWTSKHNAETAESIRPNKYENSPFADQVQCQIHQNSL